MNYTIEYLNEVSQIITKINCDSIEKIVDKLYSVRINGGRVFLLGVGGSAANCSHAVNDLRKICGIEAYTPTDNVYEITARTNDNGWKSVFVDYLEVSNLKSSDMIFVMSVGGGNRTTNTSVNIVLALTYASDIGAKIVGIVGRDDGVTAQIANPCIIIPSVNIDHITPHTESFQAMILHLIVSHPKLK
jgi:D-sedoheptulose 7-phosphate isomerase